MFRYSLGRVYQELKSIMMGMGHDNSMIYSQDDTIIEVLAKGHFLTRGIVESASAPYRSRCQEQMPGADARSRCQEQMPA